MNTKSSGFSLVEVMVAMLLLSIVLLSALKIVHETFQTDQQSRYYMQAMLEINNMAEALQAGDSQFQSTWRIGIKKDFPKGAAAVVKTGNQAVITIRWFNKTAQQEQHLSLTVAA